MLIARRRLGCCVRPNGCGWADGSARKRLVRRPAASRSRKRGCPGSVSTKPSAQAEWRENLANCDPIRTDTHLSAIQVPAGVVTVTFGCGSGGGTGGPPAAIAAARSGAHTLEARFSTPGWVGNPGVISRITMESCGFTARWTVAGTVDGAAPERKRTTERVECNGWLPVRNSKAGGELVWRPCLWSVCARGALWSAWSWQRPQGAGGAGSGPWVDVVAARSRGRSGESAVCVQRLSEIAVRDGIASAALGFRLPNTDYTI
jgi:hypothetical protein